MGAPVPEAAIQRIVRVAEKDLLPNRIPECLLTSHASASVPLRALTCHQCAQLQPIPRVTAPALMDFLKDYMDTQTPVIITG
ncbi:hypothetical protein SARC_15783, partial [Sphaeroforma arctica JP610]